METTVKDLTMRPQDDAIAGTCHDETRGGAEELERQNLALAEADRQKDLFLAMLAHELKNPLQSIRMGLALLSESRAEENAFAEWAGLIGAQVDAIFEIVNDLSDVARVKSGKLTLRRERVPARQVMHRAIESVRGAMMSRRHRLTTILPSDELYVTGDPQRLRQVFVNLLANAAKFTPDGGEIGFAGGAEGDDIVFRVWDRGIGISPAMLPHLFEVYYQAQTTDASQRGLGLGLPIVRELVALHGGTIAVRSGGPGCGSEFAVRLPATASDGDWQSE
jgi:signal transduction histidine kinase